MDGATFRQLLCVYLNQFEAATMVKQQITDFIVSNSHRFYVFSYQFLALWLFSSSPLASALRFQIQFCSFVLYLSFMSCDPHPAIDDCIGCVRLICVDALCD